MHNAYQVQGNSSKKSSEASTKLAGTGSMSFSKLALLKSNATDYLNGFIQFSKKGRRPHDLFNTEEALEKPEPFQTYETLESQARTQDDDARLNFQKFNLLKLNYNTNASNPAPQDSSNTFLWKKGKTSSVSILKNAKKKSSHKSMKSQTGLPSHKREMSLDRFRDQLQQYK